MYVDTGSACAATGASPEGGHGGERDRLQMHCEADHCQEPCGEWSILRCMDFSTLAQSCFIIHMYHVHVPYIRCIS